MKISSNPTKGEAAFKFNRSKKKNDFVEFDVSLKGLDNTTIYHLALHGLHRILNYCVDPKASYHQIRDGKLAKPKEVPLITRAIAEVYKKTESEAKDFWNELTPESKRLLRKDARLKMALIALDEDVVEIDINSLS